MKSDSIKLWSEAINEPPLGYKEYFSFEEEYLKNNLMPDDVVMDVGCGDGRSIIPIAKYAKKYIAIDNDSEAIKDANNNLKGIDNVSVLKADAEDLPFDDKSLDVVFIGLTFVNFGETKFKILEEIKRVLKDNGRFIFSVFNENALEAREQMYRKHDPNYKKIDDKGSVFFETTGLFSEQFTQTEIEDIVHKAGFEISDFQKGEIYYMITAKKVDK